MRGTNIRATRDQNIQATRGTTRDVNIWTTKERNIWIAVTGILETIRRTVIRPAGVQKVGQWRVRILIFERRGVRWWNVLSHLTVATLATQRGMTKLDDKVRNEPSFFSRSSPETVGNFLLRGPPLDGGAKKNVEFNSDCTGVGMCWLWWVTLHSIVYHRPSLHWDSLPLTYHHKSTTAQLQDAVIRLRSLQELGDSTSRKMYRRNTRGLGSWVYPDRERMATRSSSYRSGNSIRQRHRQMWWRNSREIVKGKRWSVKRRGVYRRVTTVSSQ